MRMGKRLYSLVMFLVVSVLGGLLAAGLVVPVAGMTANGTSAAVENLDTLPTALKKTPQWERSQLLNADGSVLAYFYDENRVYVELDKISKTMQQAQVAIEDHRFYEHGAMDLQGTLRALVSTSQGNTQGGSTLTQQYVRLVLVEQAIESGSEEAKAAATENTVARKIRELRYAIAVEEEFSKDQILERYLNIAYYGDGAYGVEAAARHYFGVHASELNLAQSAMLAGLVRNPVATNPRTHPVPGISRRDDVINRMQGLELVTKAQADKAKATKFNPKKMKFSRMGCANSKLPFICDYALEVLTKQATDLGSTQAERLNRVYRGGLTVTTQIDPKAQKSAQRAVSQNVDPRDPAIGVITMMDPQTGLIHAMAQSRPKMGTNRKKGETFYNYAVGTDMGGADGFQGGSTFKVFVAAAALDKGFGVNTSFNVQFHRNYKGQVFRTCSGPVRWPSKWIVDNPEKGRYNMLNGTAQSVNNYYVPLEQKVGLCATTNMAKKVGLELASGADIVKEYNEYPSFTLGAAEITPLSMVTAYGTFANRGKRCNPIILKSIKTSEGAKLKVPSAGCNQVISEDLADAVNKVYQTPYTSGTLRGAQIAGYKLAGKTGTVPGNKAAWTVGYTPNLVTAAVISYDNNKRYKKFWRNHRGYLHNVTLPYSKTWLTGFGSDAGAKMMRPAMTRALADLDQRDGWHQPSQEMWSGKTSGIPSCSGLGVSACKSALNKAGFGSYTDSQQYSDTVGKGGLIGLNRYGTAPLGSDIGLIVSRGKKPAPQPTTTTPKSTSKPTSKPTKKGR